MIVEWSAGGSDRYASASPYAYSIRIPDFFAICIIVALRDRQCMYSIVTCVLRLRIAARSNSFEPTPRPRALSSTDTPNSAVRLSPSAGR